MALRDPHCRDQYGPWELQEKIGRGGNGEVWKASDKAGQTVAIKFLIKAKPIAYNRFRTEVQVLRDVHGINGILPVLGSELPSMLDNERPWYAMPIAKPLLDEAKHLGFREKVRSIADIAHTMEQLHTRCISHRDIKPGNLLIYENR